MYSLCVTQWYINVDMKKAVDPFYTLMFGVMEVLIIYYDALWANITLFSVPVLMEMMLESYAVN